MSASLTLSQLADLALGSPEVGAVNFTVMHTLMHAVLAKLNIADVRADISEEDKDFLSSRKDGPADADFSDKDSAITGMTDATERTDRPLTRDADKKESIPYRRSPYHELENKVAKMQEQIDRFNSLPSNEELMEQRTRGDGEKPRPVSDMWQAMQLKNRVDANEDGVSKLMSLVEDLMDDVKKLKDDNNELQKQLANAKDMDDLMKRLKDLEELANGMNDKFNLFPDPDTFNDYVTWQGLEDALRGVREELQPKDRVVIDMSQQTVTPNPSRPPSRRASTPGPSSELLEILERLGILTEKHDKLEDRVDKIEDALKNKANKEDLEGLGDIPADLLDQLKQFAADIEELKRTKDKLHSLSRKIKELQNRPIALAAPAGVSPSVAPATSQQSSEHDSSPGLLAPTPFSEGTLSPTPTPYPDMSLEISGLRDEIDKLTSRTDSIDEQVSAVDDRLLRSVASLDEQMRELQDLVAYNSSGLSPDMFQMDDDIESPDMIETENKESSSKEDIQLDIAQKSSTEPEDSPDSIAKIDSPPAKEEVAVEVEKEVAAKEVIVREIVPMEGGLQKNEFDQFVQQNKAQLQALQQKLKHMGQENSRMLMESRHKIKGIEERLAAFMGDLAAVKGGKMKPPEVKIVEVASTIIQTDLPPAVRKKSIDSDALNRLQQSLFNLQSELERVSKTCQNLVDENGNRMKDIESLFTLCKELDENKADKEWVQNEIEVKADKRHLDSKVNRTLFDTTCEELNKMINDILCKLNGHEDEWKKALGQITEDLDGKLDRLEFGPIRDEIERQLRALMRKLNSLNMHGDATDDDAAGIRKQLVQRFHCISCDRPVDMMPQGPIPSIPQPQGMPASRSARPYTTFELDQIRQHAKSDGLPPIPNLFGKCQTNYERAIIERHLARSRVHSRLSWTVHFGKDEKNKYAMYTSFPHTQQQSLSQSGGGGTEITDLYSHNRACGGSHTMTFPHRRITRATHINNLFREDDPVVQPYKEELDVQGADGHIYRGRVDKLPNLQPNPPAGKGSPKMARRAQTVLGTMPESPSSPRASSARVNSPRPGSGQNRPHSAGINNRATEVPTAAEPSPTPQPPPAAANQSDHAVTVQE